LQNAPEVLVQQISECWLTLYTIF